MHDPWNDAVTASGETVRKGALAVHDHMAGRAGEQTTAGFSTELLPRTVGENRRDVWPMNKKERTPNTPTHTQLLLQRVAERTSLPCAREG